MHKKEPVMNGLMEQKLLPLYYHDDVDTSISILRALYNAGIKLVEYVARGQHALNNFKEMKKAVDADMPGMLIGIGTIKTSKDAELFVSAGADFVVSPLVDTGVAQVADKAGLLWIPGCMTPTEIGQAEQAGATLVKIFPGNILGPAFITAIKDLFPAIKFMPTGGVESEKTNLAAWFNAGVVAVGMGSKLITKELIVSKDFEGITRNTSDATALIQEVTVKNKALSI
jgi:2-dehydro-3-deoxyphosphogluconate aldolase / (4S)-4-hydroxy-2-oxoglutarate aldolase